MGRRDSFSASKAAATISIPAPNSTVANLAAKFQNVGLTLQDMVALSGMNLLWFFKLCLGVKLPDRDYCAGAHTMGMARCSTFSSRLQDLSNSDGPDVNVDFLQSLQQLCSEPGNTALAQLDLVTPATFDNQYYINLLSSEGLLQSDQALVTGNDQTRQIVESYVEDPLIFFEDFKNSMLKMGRLAPLTGENGEIRRNCRAAN